MPKYMHRPISKRVWQIGILSVLLIFITVAFVLIRTHLKPLLTSLATARVSNTVNRLVASAVDETLRSENVDYDTLIHLEKDYDGRVSAIKSNMIAFNRLQSSITQAVLEKLGEVSTKEISIPLGTLTGSSLLAGRGPAIRVKMQSVGSSQAHFENVFSAAGINQTRHQITLDVDVSVSILLPGFSTGTMVSSRYTVAETVIVGLVPESYTYFSADTPTEKIEDEFLDLD